MPKDCQMLLFFSTYDDEVIKFAKTVVPDPIIIRQRESLENIKQYYVVCRDKEDKFQALSNMYGVVPIGQCIVFCHVSVKKSFPRSPFFPFLLHFCSLSPNVPRPRKWSLCSIDFSSLRKQPTFCEATTGFAAKWRLRNERRNSIMMTRHYPDLSSVSYWSCRVGKFASANQKHYPDLGSDPLSVWNFYARFSDVFSRGNPWWRWEMSAVFSG